MILHAKTSNLIRYIYSQFSKLRVLRRYIWRIINTIATSLHLTLKICSDVCPRTLSVPQSSQFSSSYALGKLLASRNRQCPRTNIRAYFRPKWRLLFIYPAYWSLTLISIPVGRVTKKYNCTCFAVSCCLKLTHCSLYKTTFYLTFAKYNSWLCHESCLNFGF